MHMSNLINQLEASKEQHFIIKLIKMLNILINFFFKLFIPKYMILILII